MRKTIEHWRPISHIPKTYEFDSLMHTEKGLHILTTDTNNRIQIIFQNILSLRYADEGQRLYSIAELKEQHEQAFFATAVLFKTTTSDYINQLWLQSDKNISLKGIQHFLFMDSTCLIDIISYTDPIIESIP